MKNELSSALGRYLANAGVLYVKLHNLHWNVVGPDFRQTHEYLETLYDSLADVLDAVAELLKMHGVYPPASLKEYLELATLEELGSEDRRCGDALAIVQQDLAVLKVQAEEIRALAEGEGLYDAVSAMEEQLSGYNKTLWFLQAMGK